MEKYRIGTVCVSLDSADAGCSWQSEAPFERFAAPGKARADATLRIHCGSMPSLSLGQSIFDTDQGWRLFRQNGKWIVHVRSSDQDPYQLAAFEADYHRGDIYLAASQADPGQAPFPLAYPLGKVFMINLLSRGYGLLMHACGVKDGGRGLLFAGISHAGKTTMARLWAGRDGASLLGDDNVILGQRDGELWIYGTPWPGEGGVFAPQAAPLKQVFVLRQARENQIAPLRPAAAASRLLVRSFPTFWDAEGMAFTTELLGRLSQTVPCYELGFVPRPRAVDFVRALPLP